MAIDIVIHGLGSTGDGVGRLPDGRVVFVEGALPGDTVTIDVGERRKKIHRAHLLNICSPSPQRTVGLCASEVCGGCPLRFFATNAQHQWKARRVRDNLQRIGHLELPADPPLIVSGDGWHYRHRARLHARWSGQSWRLGYHARRTRDVIPYSCCPVLWPELDRAINRLGMGLHGLGEEAAIREVEVIYSRADRRVCARMIADGPLSAFKDNLDWFERSGLSGVLLETSDVRWAYGNTLLRYDHSSDLTITLEPGSFSQANPDLNKQLVAAVLEMTQSREHPRVVELYGGIGNFALPLAASGARVTMVEANRIAAQQCARNATAQGLDITLLVKDATDAIVEALDCDILLLDPPRSGAFQLAQALSQEEDGPSRVIYVSCDSATLGRDLGILVAGGFELTDLRCFDMFPQTAHVETLAVLDRAT